MPAPDRKRTAKGWGNKAARNRRYKSLRRDVKAEIQDELEDWQESDEDN